MGCGTSTANDKDENEGSKFDFSRRNTIVEKPNVVVEIGKGVKKIDPERRIVFIFGRWNCFFCLWTILCCWFIVPFTLPRNNLCFSLWPNTPPNANHKEYFWYPTGRMPVGCKNICTNLNIKNLTLDSSSSGEILCEGNFDILSIKVVVNWAQIQAGFSIKVRMQN